MKRIAGWLALVVVVIAVAAVLSKGPAPLENEATVQGLLAQESALHEKCKDGGGATADEMQATQKFCEARDRIYSELTGRGWCFGEGKEFEYQKNWAPCRKGSTAAQVSALTQLGSTVASKLTPTEEAQEIVVAKGMMASPGAIVCPDFKTVGIAYDRFVDYLRDQVVRRYTSAERQKQMELLNGKQRVQYPDINIYGCAMAPPGTELHIDRTNIVPVVVGVLANGQILRGVTNPGMIEEAPSQSTSNQPDGQAVVGTSPSDAPKDGSGQ
jgi:hypothetical protein